MPFSEAYVLGLRDSGSTISSLLPAGGSFRVNSLTGGPSFPVTNTGAPQLWRQALLCGVDDVNATSRFGFLLFQSSSS